MRRRSASFWIVAGGLLSLLCSANLAATLYAVYGQRFGFPRATLALIFATYTLVLVPALLACGQLSDRFGRRPVILAGLTTGIAGLALFALARSVAWLFAARAVQGLSVAMISGAAVAALAELEPDGDALRSALVATVALTGGTATGPLLGGVLAQWAPDPLVTPYLVGIALIAVSIVTGLAIPETVADRAGRGWRIQRPGVPGEIRGAFTRVAVTGAAVWSVAALFVSVVPSYTAEITGSTDLALLGAVSSLLLLASCASQALVRRVAARTSAQAAGLGLLALGLVGLVLAAPLGTVGVLVAGAVLAGAGHGVGFLAAQHGLNRIAPEARRGELNAAFYTSIYLGVSVSVIGVGVLADAASLFTGLVVFAAITGAASLLVAGWQLATDRRQRRSGRRAGELAFARGRDGEAGR
jgi:MFS family permease